MKPTFLLFGILALLVISSDAPVRAATEKAALPAAAENLTAAVRAATGQGRRMIVFLFSLDDARAPDAAALMQELYQQRRQYNFDIIGVALDADRADAVHAFITAHRLAFTVMRDTGGTLAEQFGMAGTSGFVLLNEQGRQVGFRQTAHTPEHMNLGQQWKTYLSAQLHMPYVPADQPVLGLKPAVPSFEAATIDGRKISVAELHRARPLVLAIFSPRCASCVAELDFFNSLYTAELKGRFELLAVSLMPAGPTADFMRDNGYAFPAVADPHWQIVSLFETFTGPVPTTFIINPQGSVEHAVVGFNDYLRDIYRMKLRKLVGMDNPPLLVKGGYSGEQSCAICHEQQHLQWSLTGHASAFASLRRKGETGNPQCIGCHVTGYEQPGGYRRGRGPRYLENVQCESCHGPGYQSCSAYTGQKTEKKSAVQWRALCVSCHTEKESLNFVFPRRFMQVRHTAMPDLEGLDRDGRSALLDRSGSRENPFDNPARYVGADACRSCHAEQYRHWQSTAHAGLQPDSDAAVGKLYRFVTGINAEGGYPTEGRTGVQCEACHGPGERHIQQPEAKGHGFIVGLGAECPSCVVEQICRTCHGAQDDPDFDFDRAINPVRHPKTAP
jgi:peroxiredoxin